MVGKILAATVSLLMIWAALAQIAPQWFQMRHDNRLKNILWGENTKWVALILVSILVSIYIWNLEDRLTVITKSDQALPTDQTGLRFNSWASSDKFCAANLDASKVPHNFRNKYEVALICGISDPAVDRFKDDRITVSSLFTIQETIPISTPNSTKMNDVIAKELEKAMNIPTLPKGTPINIGYMMWFRAVLLPQKFDVNNIHTLNDVLTHGGEMATIAPGVTVMVTRTVK